MSEIATDDWDALHSLADRVGVPTERVSQLRRRIERASSRPGSPYTLLVGRADAGIELVLARWISPDVAEKLEAAAAQPLVIGASPHDVRPAVGAWPVEKWPKFGPGHLIALRAAGKLPADTAAQLASCGHVDLVVLVTRLGQPMHQAERELARSLASLGATARVLIVALPGEEPTESDRADVQHFAVNQMRQAGFREGRCLGAGVWFATDAGRDQPLGCVSDLTGFLHVAEEEAAAGRSGMFRAALEVLFAQIGQRCSGAESATPPVALPEEERARLVRELTGYLADLGRELVRQAERRPMTAETLRAKALEALQSWGAYTEIEGHWMKYVERLRPGAHAALLTEARNALADLSYEPPRAPETPAPEAASVDRLMIEAKRLGIGLACGLAGYGLTAFYLGSLPGGSVPGLPPVVATILSIAALLLGTILGYGAARRMIRTPPTDVPSASPEPPEPGGLANWSQVERRLATWFANAIQSQPLSPAEDYRALARKLGIVEQQA